VKSRGFWPLLSGVPETLFCSRTWFAVFGGVRIGEQNQYSSRVRPRTSFSLTWRALIACVLLCHGTAAWPQNPSGSYGEAIDLLRAGQDDLAAKRLAAVTTYEMQQGREALFTAFASKQREVSERAAATMRAAVLVHTERAFAAIARDNLKEFRDQLAFAESYIDKLVAADHRSPFARTWRVLVLAFFHEGRFVLAADQFARRAHDAGGDSAEFLLALGATEEMAWWIHHEEDEDPGIKGDLKDAERHYRQALILSPDLVEARVRLGHVLLLRDDAEGMKILAQVGERAEVSDRYLANLFEGEALEKSGEITEAERRYATAVSLIPTAQSAHMALAHLHHARGARAEAAEEVRSTSRPDGVGDTSDPWFLYSRGTALRGRRYLDELRSMIAP
jgi:tetratricopeptide (TPR) repeat protein